MSDFFSRLATLFVALFFSVSSGLAEGYDPCPRLEDASSQDPTGPKLLWNLVFGSEESSENPSYHSDHDFFVTINPGRFVNVRCDDAQFEQQEMYPIGVVVRPIGYVPLADFENAHDDKAILVITEFGHRKLIRERDLSPILHNATYVFTDSPINSRICRTSGDCPGNDPSVCDRPSPCRYEVSARHGYAIAATDRPEVQSAIAAYQLVSRSSRESQADLMIGEDLQRAARVRRAACAPFPVKAYKFGGQAHQVRDSYFTLCAKRAGFDGPVDAIAPIKLVTMEYAQRAFAFHMDGSFHRRFGVNASGNTANLLSSLTDYQITSVKECGTEITQNSDVDFSGGLKASLNAGVVEISAGAEASLSAQIQHTLSADDYLLMSTYMIVPFQGAPETSGDDDSDLWFFRIVFRSRCDNGTPKEATSIVIHYHRLSSQMLEVRASDDLRASYVEKWSEYGYAPDNSASALREGQFWRIKDLQSYFIWRDTLRNFIAEENNVTSNLLFKHKKENRAYVRDFFVHLMLAAAYHHSDPSLGG
ncbi:hypothetical protein BXY66_0616 [Shimia isoporae]|uniref:Uncharacterized protein n=1 Tax=Shimia isoporae TaxID=647720 RepID=A0A4R1NLJ0_9RHOB|nr:hypothetical protein [Shimia isoporae]TCL08579.1 hypothetical protein BXY66_0616 [Shimia isoporae]